MKILITGGSGFIGSHLANAYQNKVTIVDNLVHPSSHPFLHPQEVIRGDIADHHTLLPLIESADICIHLAGVSGVMYSIAHPETTYNYNIHGTQIISQLCRKFNTKLIFTSSRDIYGEQSALPVPENAFKHPKNPYAYSKYVGEAIVSGVPNHSILRLTNVYGIGDSGRVIPTFINNALQGKPLEIRGRNTIVDFIYIDDIIEAIKKAIDKNVTLNIGSGIGYPLEKVASIIIKLTNSSSKINIVDSHDMVTDQFIADISKAEKFGWKPKISLEVGLKKIIEDK